MNIDDEEIFDMLTECLELLRQVQELEPHIGVHCIDLVDLAKAVNAEARSTVGHFEGYTMTAVDQTDGMLYSGDRVAVVKNEGARKTTDWPLALPQIVARISDARHVDTETGEAERIEDAVCRILPEIVPMTGSVSPKSAGMKALGLDPKAFTQVGEWRRKLVIEDVTTQDGGAA